MLIQAFVPSGDDEYELIAKEDAKATAEVNRYIDDLSNNNAKLGGFMRKLWNSIRQEPEKYRDQNVSLLLEDMIMDAQEEELSYVVNNYNPNKEKQYGENELKRSSDYAAYRETEKNPVSRLKYWKTVQSDLKELMQNDLLPLQRK